MNINKMKIPIVNEQDEIIGYKDRYERNPKDVCRVTGLWVTDPDGDILLARRGLTKKHHPGVWGSVVSGTVEEGETYEINIIKEAEEEIGLTETEFKIGPKMRRSTSHNYFVQWFTVVVDRKYPFKKREGEVEEIRWFSKDEIPKFLKETPEEFLIGLKEYIDFFSNYNETQS